MEQGVKRKADSQANGPREKQAKTRKQWRVPKKGGTTAPARAIASGDSGIWVTCDKGREGKCIGEMRDLFNEYAQELYGDALKGGDDSNGTGDNDADTFDIESEIKAEVSQIKTPSTQQLFTPMRIDVQCVTFFKTQSPIEPVSFVERICSDAMKNPQRKRSRFARRLSPMTLLGRATEEGLAKVAKEVLAPHFHQNPEQSKKFAIRPTFRNHNTLSRDMVIKQVASIVGPGHKVDLKDYDLLIMVEIHENVCGVSVVGKEFERLKRFNLAEIFDPTAKADVEKKPETAT